MREQGNRGEKQKLKTTKLNQPYLEPEEKLGPGLQERTRRGNKRETKPSQNMSEEKANPRKGRKKKASTG